MKTTLPIKAIDGKVHQNRKENHFVKQYTAINKDLEEVIILRIYATDAQHYACVWLRHKKEMLYSCGGGRAGGYGYHRASQAAEYALNDAGILFNNPIGGRGDSAIREALEAVAYACGYRKILIHEAHA